MRINRLNLLLALLLVVQAVIAVVSFATANTAAAPVQAGGPLLTNFAPDSITQLSIRDGSQNEVVLGKDANSAWVLPGADNFPVDATKVSTLLTALGGMTTSRLIAESPASHRQLKVATDSFERSIQFTTAAGQGVSLLVGTSVGGSAAHVRLADRDQVYLVSGVQTWQIPAEVGQWVNTSYFSVPLEEIAGVRIQNANGLFEFTKLDNAWQTSGLPAGASFDQQSITNLLPGLTALNLSKPLGSTLKDTYGLNPPTATITLIRRRVLTPTPLPTLTPTPALGGGLLNDTPAPLPTLPAPSTSFEETTLTVLVGAKLENGNYVVKASNSAYYVEVAAFSVESVLGLTREKLVLPTPVPSATPTVTATLEATATTAASATAEPSATPTATLTMAATATALPSSTATMTSSPTPTN
jgi:hypothetical protein